MSHLSGPDEWGQITSYQPLTSEHLVQVAAHTPVRIISADRERYVLRRAAD